MKIRSCFKVVGASVGLFLLSSVGSAQGPGSVLSHQKISGSFGGFTGVLDDGDLFGAGLVALGDLDGDGIRDLAAGARRDDDGGTDRGAIWILFLNADGTVKSHQKISDTAGGFTGVLDDGDWFGVEMASLGDLDGDGVGDLAVGAVDDDGGTNRGAIWVLFLNTDGTVKSHQKISDTAGGFTGVLDDGDVFATPTSLGDLDGDGVTDLAVGAWGDDDGGTDRGAVWILFLNTDGTVKSHQKISDTMGGFTGMLDDGDFFGAGMTSLGDLDDDGVTDLAVGARADDDGGGLGANRGAVWILFLKTDGTVNSHQKISDTQGGFVGQLGNADEFGIALSCIGDQNGDRVVDLAVGADHDDDGLLGNNRGAVWILFLDTDGTVKSHQKISDTQGGFSAGLGSGDTFGRTVASLGDLDGDGKGDLAVSAVQDDDGGPNRGAVWILFLDATHWLDLGGGTVGSNGAVTLVGTGSLVGGTTASLDLTNAPPGALTLAWLSFTSAPQSFFGGTIHATPFSNQFLFLADGGGAVSIPTTWPSSIPAGTQAWFQFLVADPSVIWGITLSNGLKITTP